MRAALIRVAALTLVSAIASACDSAPVIPDGSSEGSPAGTQQAGLDDCAPSDLRMPSGERIDLTGTWEGASARLFIGQYGECIWIEEFSADAREGLGDSYRRLFFGRLAADFTITGRFADVYEAGVPPLFGYEIPPEGVTQYRVIIRPEGGSDVVVLEGRRRESTEVGFFPTVEYVRTASETELPFP